jgi:putative CocE/NonD family hydrolase
MGTVEGRGIMVDVDVAVIMRDGAVLRADVHRPAAGGPFPALVHRSAYGKQNAPMVSGLVADPKVLAAAGFAVVVQDVRGRFASEGEWAPFVHEMDDGYDTVEWAASQPWCTGEVGCYGSSYMGITTHLAVAAKPPHLRAAAVLVASRDPNDGLLRTGGAFEQGFLTRWALNNAADTVSRLDLDPTDAADLASCAALAASDPWSVIADLPVRDAELLAAVAPYWREWIDRPPGDGHWARTWGLPAQVGVPLLSVVGFRDWMQPSMLGLFERIQDGRHRLVAGPWTHLSAYGGPTGERDWTAAAPGGPAAFGPLLLAWFSRWMGAAGAHGSRGREPQEPAVRYFATGVDRWMDARRWPPPGRDLVLWLGDGDRLEPDAGGPEGQRTFSYDPADPVPTAGGMICQPDIGPDGVVDQRSVEARADVVVSTTPPLDAAVAVAGPSRAELWITTSAEDTDVMVKLVDVEPDGYAANVTEGVLRARYRNGGPRDWLVPGRATMVTVKLADVAHTFLTGHRIRLDVTSSNYPRLSRNLNTRILPEAGTLADAVVADQAVLHGGRHASRLVLHIV